MHLTPPPVRHVSNAMRACARGTSILVLLVAMAGCLDPAAATKPSDISSPRLAITSSSQKLVISQVYGGGGNSGAPYTNDFVELFNAGAEDVNLSGMSVQYASATGTGNFGSNSTMLTVLTATTLVPGQHYLVQLAGSTAGVALPAANATGTINLSGTAGKVALVNSTTTLGCNGGSAACNAAQLALIVDLLGYGTANFFETAAAPGLSNTTAAIRRNNGCTDSNNNSADFTAAAPAPRNMASPLTPCSALPSVTSVTPANNATDVVPSSNLTVTFDRAVAVSDSWYAISCTVSGSHAAQVSGAATSYVIDPDADFAFGDACTVTITASLVSDAGNSTATMALNYVWAFSVMATDPCTATFTPAYAIQGNGPASPLVGQVVSTKGVVVGDYEGASPALRGFYLQDATGDGDASTSDAVFVFNANNNSVANGDVVWVRGSVSEFQEQTQLSASAVVKCGIGSVTPVDVMLPVASATALERYEGMLVRLPQTLTVTEHFQLGRFGQVVLSSGDRLFQPTNVAAPGAAAQAVQAMNDLNRIIVDDDNNGSNPDPIVFGRGGNPLSASNTLRGGDVATNVVGVLTYTWSGNAASGNAYRVRPVNALGGAVNFMAVNPRTTAPESVGGTLKVAVMNLLNYFNTFSGCRNGVGGGSTDCRGADDAVEFERQSAKTVAAVVGMNADVLGIVEVENDGYGAGSAMADLVSRVNAVMGAGTYSYVDVDAATGQVNALGTDAIKVGVLYKPAAVTPVGKTAVLNSVQFVNGGDASPRNRPSLAQTFEQASGARVIVSINHLKSKGSACAAPDANDGQGNCNAVRVAAASALRDWLATDPTETADPDILILGDLNAYAMEDPVTVLRTAGFADLIKTRLGARAYSYAFNGQWGYLDHALASTSLTSQVSGVAEWHINADEPSVLDYNVNFKTPAQVAGLYAADAYRVSDHDPVVVGLTLNPPLPFGGFLSPINGGTVFNAVNAPSTVPVRFSVGGNLGTDILANGYPLSRPIDCTTGDVLGGGSPIASTGAKTLSYTGNAYHINWKTERAWAGTCRELVIRFVDGSQHSARFSFR